MNKDVKLMIATPGRYAIAAPGFKRFHREYFAVEVTADGTVYQLNPQGVRDGVLGPDGWASDVEVYTVNEGETIFVRFPWAMKGQS